MVSTRKVLALLAGSLLAAVAGTGYMFSAYAPQFKKTMGYSQAQIELVGTIGNVGGYCAFAMGTFYDTFGPRITVLVNCILMFAGYFLLYLGAQHKFYTTEVLMGAFLAMTGIAAGGYYTAGLATSMKNFNTKHVGKIVGIIAGLFGLSAAIFTNIYKYAFAPNEIRLFLFLAIAITAIGAFASIFLFDTSKKSSGYSEVDESQPLIQLETKKPQRGLQLNPLQLFANLEFYLLVLTFFCITGPGLTTINNLGNMVESLGGSPDMGSNIVITFSLSNFIGRIILGYLSDHTNKHVSRGFYVMVVALLMSATQALLAYSTLNLLYLGTILTGLAYGGGWALVPSIVRELWGTRYFGTNFGIMGLSPALGSFIFAAELSGHLYDNRIPRDEWNNGVRVCHGPLCYRETFQILSCVSMFGFFISYLFLIRTRKFYFPSSEDKFAAKYYTSS